MNDEQTSLLGMKAAKFFTDEAWVKAWADVRARLIEEMERAPSNDPEHVMHFKRMLSSLNAVKATMEGYVTSGRIADQNIEYARKSKLKSFFRVA